MPRMLWDREVWCLIDNDGRGIRAQCSDPSEDGERVCLWSSDCVKGTRGSRCQPLERVNQCRLPGRRQHLTYEGLRGAGFRFVEAIAEAPPGWMRDARGRVFQYNFDLNRRVWIGTRWHYSHRAPDSDELGRIALSSGLRAEVLSSSMRWRYRYHAMLADVYLNPLQVTGTLLRVDTSHESNTPLFRITTFWPDPERHDTYLNLGWWGELGSIEHSPRGSAQDTMIRIAAGGATLDLWHNPDLSSFVRLRSGVGIDELVLRGPEEVQGRVAITPMVYAEGDTTFDRDGFHHLTVGSGFEAPFIMRDGEDPLATYRFKNEVAYEVIMLAINDQPLTLRATVGGGYRDDVLSSASGWEVNAGIGLRISLWAPARDLAALDRATRELEASE